MYGLVLPALEAPVSRSAYLALSASVRPLVSRGPRPDTSFQILGSYLATSHTLGAALTQLAEFVEFGGNPGGLQLVRGEQWSLRYSFSHLPIGESPYAAALPACYALQVLSFLGWLIDAPVVLSGATLMGPEPLDAHYVRQRLDCPLLWSGSANELVFSGAILARPQLRSAGDIERFFGHWHNLLMMAPLHSLQLRERVETLLRARLGNTALPCVAQAAELLGYATTTFRRQLHQEGCSYMQIKDDVRAARARDYLENSNLSLEQIAVRLGFNDVGNFHHAFRRWHGTTPAALRADLR